MAAPLHWFFCVWGAVAVSILAIMNNPIKSLWPMCLLLCAAGSVRANDGQCAADSTNATLPGMGWGDTANVTSAKSVRHGSPRRCVTVDLYGRRLSARDGQCVILDNKKKQYIKKEK